MEGAGLVELRFASDGTTPLRRNGRNYSHEVVQLNETAHLTA
jgi:hypothetical protein